MSDVVVVWLTVYIPKADQTYSRTHPYNWAQPLYQGHRYDDRQTAHSAVKGITVLCHFRKNSPMPVIICKNDKHLVILYNVIFLNMTGILSYLSYIFY